MKFNYGLIIAIAFISVIASQFIATSYGYDYVSSMTLQRIQNLIQEYLPVLIKNNMIPDMQVSSLKLENFTLASTSVNVLGSYVNLKNSKIILSPNKIYFTYNFNCNQGGSTVKGELEISVYDAQLLLKYDPKTTNTTASVKVNVREKDINVYGVDAAKTAIKTAILNYMKEKKLKDIIVNDFNTNLKVYFTRSYLDRIRNYRLKLGDVFSQKELEIDLRAFFGMCESSTYESGICFYSGNATHVENFDNYRLSYQNIPDFITWESKYKAFLHLDLFNYIMKANFASPMLLNKNSKVVAEQSLDFSLKNLKQVFDSITGDDEDFFTVQSTLTAFNIAKDKSGTLSLASSIIVNNAIASNVTSNIKFQENLKEVGNKVSFDLCMKEATLEKYEVTGGAKVKDDAKFKDFYGKILEYVNKNENVCISDSGISLRDYFRYYESISQTEEGLYIVGQKLYGY